jgi:hypothetical protein
MASHRSHTYQPFSVAPKRPFKRSVQVFLIEWTPIIATLVLAALVLGMALQLAN